MQKTVVRTADLPSVRATVRRLDAIIAAAGDDPHLQGTMRVARFVVCRSLAGLDESEAPLPRRVTLH
jgi:hypothetical protein